MSLEWSSGRDWVFPSPSSFIRSSSHSSASTQYPRRFFSKQRLSRPYPLNPPSPPTSTIRNDFNRSGIRRRVEFPISNEKPEPLHGLSKDHPPAKVSVEKQLIEFSIRWRIAVLILAIIFSLLLLLRNIHLQSQVNQLQSEVLNLNHRLGACNKLDVLDIMSSPAQDGDPCPSGRFKRNVALFFSLTLLFIPLLIFKYIDYVSKSRVSENTSEEVSLNKRIAYRVDVFLSVHPYAKPLVLLVATLLLIFLGGLALFGVTTEDLAHCLWLSWTYVADSGNHASSEGIGPRLVAVSISFGGMLIFAMMLGLVSDTISEKFDSLRKGKSEVVEQNHTLILGWSDKLGSLLNQLSIANESLGGGTVVVMAERDKEEMELDIAKMEFDFKGTSVICRSGSPLILADLKRFLFQRHVQ